MLSSIPWRLIIWAGAGLVVLYTIGGMIFGKARRPRVLLVNGISGLAAAWVASVVGGFFGAALQLNLAMLLCSTLLGAPGALLVCALQWIG